MAVDLGWVVGVNSTLTSTFSYRGILERGLLPLFYLVPPSKSSFETLEEVPTYVNDVRNKACLSVHLYDKSTYDDMSIFLLSSCD